MHCCLGIMRIGEEYLLPIASELGYVGINKKDFKLADWSQHDSFLMVVAEAAVIWLCNLLPAKYKQLPFDEILAKINANKHVSHLYIYFLIISLIYNMHFRLYALLGCCVLIHNYGMLCVKTM